MEKNLQVAVKAFNVLSEPVDDLSSKVKTKIEQVKGFGVKQSPSPK